MTNRFTLSTRTVEDVTFLKVSGVIDEDNKLASSLRKIEGRTVVVDSSEVNRINSCGVRDWVNWLNELDVRGKKVILVRCSPVIVNQLNLVNNFIGRGVVKSFFAPYYCARCDTEQLELLQTDAFAGQASPNAPDVRGRGCVQPRCEMAFDDIAEAWFSFLPRAGGAVADPGLDAMLVTLSPSIRERIQRLDRVEDEAGVPTSVSGVYSPLTSTTAVSAPGSASLTGAEPEATPTEPQRRRSRTSAALAALALALAGAIVGYVLFVVGAK